MRIFLILFLLIATPSFAQVNKDYWVYVRLEDRSGVTSEDDVGRSKAGDVVAVLPVNAQNIPSETEKRSYMIYKTALTSNEKDSMLEEWEEDTGIKDDFGNPIYKKKAYRRKKLELNTLGVAVKKGLVTETILSSPTTTLKTVDDLMVYEAKRRFYAYVQRPLIRIANVITRKAFAETISTINKTGEDYNTLALWEDDKDGDLVTDTRQETAECYNDDGDLSVTNTAVAVDGSTTNASYYMKITVPEGERHNGTADESGFVVSLACTDDCNLIEVSDPYLVVEWVDFTNFTNTGSFYKTCWGFLLNASYTTIRNVMIHDYPDLQNAFYGIGSYWWNSDNNKIYNNMIYNISSASESSNSPHAIYMKDDTGNELYNNTIYNFYDAGGTDVVGINGGSDSSTNIIKNNLVVMDEGSAFVFGASQIHDYNASGDSTATGANSVTSVASSVFDTTTTGSENLHLVSGATSLIGAGTDLSGTFTNDIDDDTRSAWDIGADENISAVVSTLLQIFTTGIF